MSSVSKQRLEILCRHQELFLIPEAALRFSKMPSDINVQGFVFFLFFSYLLTYLNLTSILGDVSRSHHSYLQKITNIIFEHEA